MEPFSITTTLSKKEYVIWTLQTSYRNRLTLVLMVLGGLMITSTIYLNSILIDPEPFPWNVVLIGLAPAILPIINAAILTFSFDKNSLQHLTYTFSEEGVSLTAPTVSGTMGWEHFRSIKYTKKILVLYVSKNMAHFVKTEHLTLDQQAFIWNKIPIKK